MKNVIKKISAFAMSFALLGTSSVIAQNTNLKSSNTLVASAAATYCPNHNGVDTRMEERWFTGTEYAVYEVRKCAVCKRKLSEKYLFTYNKMIGTHYRYNIY